LKVALPARKVRSRHLGDGWGYQGSTGGERNGKCLGHGQPGYGPLDSSEHMFAHALAECPNVQLDDGFIRSNALLGARL
jgi:hypothetical protein